MIPIGLVPGSLACVGLVFGVDVRPTIAASVQHLGGVAGHHLLHMLLYSGKE